MAEIAGIKPVEVKQRLGKAPEKARSREQGGPTQEAAKALQGQRADGKAAADILSSFVTADAWAAMQQEARAGGVGVGEFMKKAAEGANQKLEKPLRVVMNQEQAEKFFTDLAETMRKRREKESPQKVLGDFAEGLI